MVRAGSVQRYARGGHRAVQGWLDSLDALLIAEVGSMQADLGVTGEVAEIGVHHGRLFILLALLRNQGERALAVDVFEQQHLNPGQSGSGDRRAFEGNLRKHGVDHDLFVLTSDSAALTPADLLQNLPKRIRLFSVDGSHTAAATAHDLFLASATLADGGVVIVDDHFNKSWPGVSEGFARFFLESTPTVVPVAIARNKVLLARPQWAERYRRGIVDRMTSRAVQTRVVSFYDASVIDVDYRVHRPLLRRLLGKFRTLVSVR